MTKPQEEHSDDKEVNMGIVITPMLDMAFQLLAFFVFTYHPSALEGHINGKLLPPEKIAIKGEKAPTKQVKAEQITDVEPDTREAVTVYIRAVAPNQVEGEGKKKRVDGQPSQILIRTPQIVQPETVADSNDELDVGLNKLLKRLRDIRSSPSGADMIVRLQPDGNLRHEYVVRVWNVCKMARFQSIGFVPPASAAAK